MKRLISLAVQYPFLFVTIHLILFSEGWSISTALTLLLVLVYVLPAYVRTKRLTQELNRVKVSEKRGYVYGFSDWGQILPTIKIGRETTKGSRLASHKTAAPFGIRVYFDFAVKDAHKAESILHQHFAKWRVKRNNEWFYLLSPYAFLEVWMLKFMKGK